MRRTTPAALALAAIAGALLAGCTPEPPAETTPPPTAEPSVSEEDARAAWEVYQQRLSELGAQPESAELEDLLTVAGSDLAQDQLENMQRAADRRIRVEGNRRTSAFEFDQAAQSARAAVCIDVSDERVVGDEGREIETGEPRTTIARSVTFARVDGATLVTQEQEFEGPPELNPCD
ncbi:hypothetical protein OVA14_03690 [Agrococcus sp. SL85]|uniref:hypothetical protein n=1 Tax=Agrococcus sp. SL85 TaxID=2995141 RepID=UPI00226D17FD|nr:hypothetical protein [Agrococcus sp. SL85]WAC66885.1 hypothetical protein OVA14_03690 [Agrococcus sp. SL85]